MKQVKELSAVLRSFFAATGEKRFLVAYSAGPDSTALLHAAAGLREVCAIELTACWVDHQLRPVAEMAAEEQLARSFCQQLAIPLIIKQAAPDQLRVSATVNQSGGIEAAARHFRYKKLEEARQQSFCQLILTAHTADDVDETMIMRFFTGAGITGLRGIADAPGLIRRPLLMFKKKDLLEYLSNHGLEPSQDSTNHTDVYLRNQVRHGLIPAISRIFPHYSRALQTLAEKHRLENDALDWYARQLLRDHDGQTCIDRTDFMNAPAAVAIRALYLLSLSFNSRIPWHFFKRAFFEGKSRAILAEGYGISVYCSKAMILVRPLTVGSVQAGAYPEFSVSVDSPGQLEIGFGLSLMIKMSANVQDLRADSCVFPLCVRSRRPGDTIKLKQGSLRLDKLMSDWKLAPNTRSLVPVVEDVDGIVAVLGKAAGAANVYRYNESLLQRQPESFLAIELKGVVSSDAI